MNPVLVSTWGPTPKKYLLAFFDTCKRNGLEPQNFDHTDWEGGGDWRQIPWYKKSEGQARFVRENKDKYSHFVFTDSYDVVFGTGMDEIMRKFERLNSPIVCAAECYCWPDINQAGLYPPCPDRCRYLNAGMWIATSEAAVPFTEELAATAAKREKDDQQILVDMFLSKRHPIALDTTCSICFCCNINSLDFLDMSGPRPRTTDTGQEPCLYHGNGASDLRGICAKIAP
jgi:endogenous inhibitor of DNA gyrase (YacG/DUF329 family)